MEIELQKNKDTLFHSLTEWNQIERDCGIQFNNKKLDEDRDFLKLRLAEYQRLQQRYGSYPRTRDERVMEAVLRIERRRLERAIYPGLVTRMLRRIVVFLSSPINVGKELEMARHAGLQSYLSKQLGSIKVQPGQWQSPDRKQPTAEIQPPENGIAQTQPLQNEFLSENKVTANAPSAKDQKEVRQQNHSATETQRQSNKPPQQQANRPHRWQTKRSKMGNKRGPSM